MYIQGNIYILKSYSRCQLCWHNINYRNYVSFLDGCQADSTILNFDLNITIEWTETNIGDTAYTLCPCGDIASETNLYANRYCGGNFVEGGEWEAGNVAVCNFSSLARELCELADVTEQFPLYCVTTCYFFS